jgi:hypothetical protein
VSQWLFGQALLMLIAFVMYYIGLSILGVPYALAIAFFGGLMEILPYIGPILAAIPAVLVGLLVSPVLGVSALIFYIIAHQAEAHIVAPQVMKHSAGLNPVALIVAILIGLELGGPRASTSPDYDDSVGVRGGCPTEKQSNQLTMNGTLSLSQHLSGIFPISRCARSRR